MIINNLKTFALVRLILEKVELVQLILEIIALVRLICCYITEYTKQVAPRF